MQVYKDFMIDIETTGTDPAVNAIIQLAVRPFNLETGEIGEEAFEVCMHIPKGRVWNQGCADWWTGDPDRKATLEYIAKNRQPWLDSMNKFKEFVREQSGQDPIGIRFWSCRTMDWEFIQSYAYSYDWDTPFHFCNYREMNAYIGGMTGLVDNKDINETRPERDEAMSHNAVYDCDWQIGWLMKVKAETEQGK